MLRAQSAELRAKIKEQRAESTGRDIVQNSLAASGKAHTIVIVFGSDHIPQIRHQFKELGINAKIPERLFVPGGSFRVPDEVMTR